MVILLYLLFIISLISGSLKFDRLVKGEILFSLIFVAFNMMSLFWLQGSIIAFIVSQQFALTAFFLSTSTIALRKMFHLDIDYFISRVALVLFFSWATFSIFGFVFLGEQIWMDDRGINRLSGALGVSPSSILNSIVFLISFYLSFLKKRRKYYLLVIISILCVFLSGTRVTIFSSAVSAFIMVIFSKDRRKYLFLLSLLPMLIYLVWTKIASRLFFTSGDQLALDSINFNGRRFLWDLLFDNMQNPVIGNGAGSSITLLQVQGVAAGIQPHNDYIRIYFDLGWIGLSIFILMICYMILRTLWRLIKTNCIRAKSEYSLVLSLLFSYVILMMTDNVYIYNFYTLPMLLIYFYVVSISQEFEEREKLI
ncbi:O-antigen ligase family protein [Vibrio navarrensis]|uniref:O-antigen ligase family protein n=1 Tax=Vibrio navarrensis TaxID=29495 RepID=UPI00186A1273|nr:O-antigen ligase family protein [Vibrio navarrensis]MBE4582235.1 hypothetical protein [Vibrio navarrensis]